MNYNITEITSTTNSKILNIAKLRDKKTRIEQKLFLVEGYHLVEEAKKHNLLRFIVTTNKNDFNIYESDGYLVTEQIIKKLSTTVNSQGIIGVVKLKEDKENYSQKTYILLDNINDPGNLGTIIRTAAALGIEHIYASSDTVDIYNDKVIRATQGSIFKISYTKVDLKEAIKKLNQNGVKVYATALDTNKTLEEVTKPKKFALIFGNEANGVRKEILDIIDNKFKIKMHNGVESLNVAIAMAITTHEFLKNK